MDHLDGYTGVPPGRWLGAVEKQSFIQLILQDKFEADCQLSSIGSVGSLPSVLLVDPSALLQDPPLRYIDTSLT